jgi:hypothetical protein
MARSLLTEYEKLVAFSQVKYKPSNASLPEPEPANLFGQLLKETARQPEPAATTAARMAAQQASAPATAVQVAAAPTASSKPAAPAGTQNSESESNSTEEVSAAAPTAGDARPRRLMAAYALTQAASNRNEPRDVPVEAL